LSLLEQLEQIGQQARQTAERTDEPQQLAQAQSAVLGRKGSLTQLLRELGTLEPSQRVEVGKVANQLKQELTELFAARRQALQSAVDRRRQQEAATYDPTTPAQRGQIGSVHPVTAVQWEIEDVFTRLGFTVEAGPEMDSEYYNFDALNTPATHPARDMQDTFWLSNGMLLRTQTSAVQVRAMEKFGPPVRVVVPGRCFRSETVDASHSNTFHQLEGLVVDYDISIANLIATMKLLLREVIGRDLPVRLRPGYFPFVEPGFELDMACQICGGKGCRTCKNTGWLEMLPCGMVHPNVLRAGNVDPREYTGFAFGLGLTRLAMMKYGISDIRTLTSPDLRGLVRPELLYGPPVVSPDDRQKG
jgi:phenylalanyl-tRNA synthetase alpha chain